MAPESNTLVIHTIGHSNHDVEKLAALLRKHGVALVVDIRSFPSSKKWPCWNRAGMEKTFPRSGLAYAWMGDSLGGYRKQGYEAYMKTAQFKAGVDKLLALAEERKTAVLCAEADFRRCHRRFLSDALERNGANVKHIMPDGAIESHPLSLGL